MKHIWKEIVQYDKWKVFVLQFYFPFLLYLLLTLVHLFVFL